jgi:hypothetical protein
MAGEPATSRTGARPGVRAGEPATPRTSAEPDRRADLPEVLLRVEAEVKTTMQLSPRQPAFQAVHLFVTVSIGRKVWLCCQAIELKLYTTRSLKRDETAGYIRLVRAAGEGDPDTVMRDEEDDGLEGERSPMESDTYVRYPIDDFSD